MKITVLGEGAWGTALATVVAHNTTPVTLWCHDSAVAQSITTTHINNRYMKGIKLSHKITATDSLEKALQDVEWIIVTTPVKYLREILTLAKPYISITARIVLACKGIEKTTLKFPSEIIKEIFPTSKTLVLAGPSFAHDVIHEQPTAVELASENLFDAQFFAHYLKRPFFSVFPTNRVQEVELCAALKNVYALGMGLLEGAGFGENTQALYLTRVIQEIHQACSELGLSTDAAFSLAGIGDIMLTAYGTQSRNKFVGKEIAQGLSLDSIITTHKIIPEGINTVESVQQFAKKYTLELPLADIIYKIIFEKESINELINILLL